MSTQSCPESENQRDVMLLKHLLLPLFFKFKGIEFGNLATSKCCKSIKCQDAPLIHSQWLIEQPSWASSINLHMILMCQSSHWVYCQPIQVQWRLVGLFTVCSERMPLSEQAGGHPNTLRLSKLLKHILIYAHWRQYYCLPKLCFSHLFTVVYAFFMFVVSWLYNPNFAVQIEKSFKTQIFFLSSCSINLLFELFSPDRSPHYACPEVIRVSHFALILMITILFPLASFSYFFIFILTNPLINTLVSSGREVWREESRRLELWGHSFCPVGGECQLVFTKWCWLDIMHFNHKGLPSHMSSLCTSCNGSKAESKCTLWTGHSQLCARGWP